jgi:hypothetical protein
LSLKDICEGIESVEGAIRLIKRPYKIPIVSIIRSEIWKIDKKEINTSKRTFKCLY